jgi:hypothetical protein
MALAHTILDPSRGLNEIYMSTADSRPPPSEFAEFVRRLSPDSDLAQDAESRINSISTAQVFDFGRVPEEVLKEQAIRSGPLMHEGFVRPPYEYVLYWYTLTDIEYPIEGQTSIDYVTLVFQKDAGAEPKDNVYRVVDFVRAPPGFADSVNARQDRDLPKVPRGHSVFALLAIGDIMPLEPDRWNGTLSWQSGTQHLTEEQKSRSVGALADGVAGLSMLLCTDNIGLRHEPAPRKLNAKRAKSGRPPYPGVTYVNVGQYLRARENTARGGTHASPVPHLRRGHRRTYANGKTIWIRDTLVNCRSLDEAAKREKYKVQPGVAD